MINVIIVDDEPRHRKGLANLIGKLRPKYVINQFKNGNEALEFVKENKVDIIITDVKMPIMDGLVFLKKYKEMESNSKVVILSGYANFEYAQNALSLGAFDYILKPVDEYIIYEILVKVEKSIQQEEEARKREIQLIDSLNNTIQVYIENQFNKWIKGELNKERLTEIKKYFHKDGEGWVMVTKIASSNKITEDSYENNQKCLQNIKWIVTEMVKPYGDNISFYFNGNENILITVIKQNDDNVNQINFEDFNERILLIKNEYDINISIGISRRCGNIYYEAKKCFDEAMEALELRFYFKNSNIISSSDEKQIRKTNIFINSKYEELLNKCIYQQDTIGAVNLMNEILVKFLEKDYPQQNELKNNIIRIFLKIIKEINMFMTNEIYNEITMNIISAINLSENIDELRQSCNLILIKIISIFERWKRNKNKIFFDKCVKYIEENYMQDISLEDISEKFHFNPSYFSTMFKEQLGMNFIKYLLKLRIKKACELLLESDKKIYEISSLVGYKDSKYFNRVFKNQMNICPDEYRRLNSSSKLEV
ncbi:HTH-type transcriptional regulator YesS [Clostridium puniceum]|uniref:Stage 0 sporulation protein A homolog n=1 Tax=Clostridium puniceum TaxID=29367 RepID=A0A1S8THP2_9CLOT|nr:response regulator [Clostridium puniceum]OOM77310.1 HTH-type transcriptional regulator YesS [Clostridium puniceum]